MFHVKPGPRICDYEGSEYRREFWEESDRAYEDAVERLTVRDLLPPRGDSLVDIGAGFGRLAPLYDGYRRVYLLDYALSMLREARSRLGDSFTYVCADLYHLPFASESIDTAVAVRVLHHVEDVPAAFSEKSRCLRVGGTLVLEYANKRHLKSVLRHLAGRAQTSPVETAPHEFVPLNWNFHPAYVDAQLAGAGLTVRERRSVSHFRLPAVKRHVDPVWLARVDRLLGRPLAPFAPGPSQFCTAAKLTGDPDGSGIWRCPACGHQPLQEKPEAVPCPSCGMAWPRRDGIFVFRQLQS